MKKSHYAFVIPTAVSFIILTLSASFQVQTAKVTGTWNMVVETSQGSGKPVIVLKQANDSIITGTYTGQFGEAPLKGIVKGNKINFKILTSDFTMEYVGIVDGNSMKGKVIFAAYGEGTFTGTKKEQ